MNPASVATTLILLVIALLISDVQASVAARRDVRRHDYCIIGAGPGGVQAAIYFQQLGMDYAVFERSPRAGDFFRRFPRHRRLISINKLYTGSNDTEFQLRHDWNSLIFNFDSGIDPDTIVDAMPKPEIFRTYSRDYFPDAGLLVSYLTNIVKRFRLRVLYNHTLTAVFKESTDESSPFLLEFAEAVPDARCKVVIMATGRDVPVRLGAQAERHLEGYETVSRNPRDFRNQTVMILGSGNAALETAQAIAHEAAVVFVASRNPISLAYQTHYVGHARAKNLAILDRYQFKSLDALLHGTGSFGDFEFRRDEALNRTFIKVNNPNVDDKEENPGRKGYDRVIRCMGFVWDQSPFNRDPKCNEDDRKRRARCQIGMSVAKVAPYSEGKQRYMEVASNFESVNVPRLFVAGTLMHFRDFKRTAGGFIHGFRYLIRTMVLQLRERFDKEPYPSLRLGPYASTQSAAKSLADLITARLSNVSSLYQMPGQLADVIIWDYDAVAQQGAAPGTHTFRLVRDIPVDQVTSKNPDVMSCERLRNAMIFMTISIEFGAGFQGMAVLAHQGQPEFEWRAAEKEIWSKAADPDVRYRRATEPASISTKKFESIVVPPLSKQRPAPNDPLMYSGQPDTAGYSFIHPVFRLYSRERQRPMQDPPQLIREFGLPEDLHNDWTLPQKHVEPLRNFLESRALKELMRGA